MCVKESNISIGLKKTCLGVLDKRERGKDNATGLKEGDGIEVKTTVLHSRAAPSLKYLPSEWSWKDTNVAAGGDTIFFRFELFEDGELGVRLFWDSNMPSSSVAWSVCGDLVSVASIAAPFAVVVLFVGLPNTCKNYFWTLNEKKYNYKNSK